LKLIIFGNTEGALKIYLFCLSNGRVTNATYISGGWCKDQLTALLAGIRSLGAGNTKGGSITVPLTSCLTGLD